MTKTFEKLRNKFVYAISNEDLEKFKEEVGNIFKDTASKIDKEIKAYEFSKLKMRVPNALRICIELTPWREDEFGGRMQFFNRMPTKTRMTISVNLRLTEKDDIASVEAKLKILEELMLEAAKHTVHTLTEKINTTFKDNENE